jgi:hypothetical protein
MSYKRPKMGNLDAFALAVIVVGHLTVRVAAPVEALAHRPEQGEPSCPVLVVTINRLPAIATRSDVIQPAG